MCKSNSFYVSDFINFFLAVVLSLILLGFLGILSHQLHIEITLFFSILKFLIALANTSSAVLEVVGEMGFPDLFVTLLGMPAVFPH